MEVYGVVKFAVDNVLSQKSAEFHESRFVCRHFILHCPKYDSERSQLIDTVNPLWHNVKANVFVLKYVFDKLHLVVAPRSDHTVTRKDDLLVKSALFDFLISTNRQL